MKTESRPDSASGVPPGHEGWINRSNFGRQKGVHEKQELLKLRANYHLQRREDNDW